MLMSPRREMLRLTALALSIVACAMVTHPALGSAFEQTRTSTISTIQQVALSQDCLSGDGERAIRACTSIIDGGATARVDVPNAYINRAFAYEGQSLHQKAIDDLSKALALDPLLGGAYSNRGTIYLGLNQIDLALADYSQAIVIDPAFVGAIYNRANVFSRMGAYDKALDDFSNALRLAPRYASGYFNRGLVYMRLGKQIEAVADFRKTLELNPAHSGAAQVLRQLGIPP